MRKSKFSEAQRLDILAKHDAGTKIADLCREHQISPATLYKWKNDHKDEQDEDKRRLKQLEKENAQLKRCLPNSALITIS